MHAIDIGGAAGPDELAISQHRNRVTDLKDLAEPVGNIDDRLALGLERAQGMEDALDLDVGQCRGWFIENEDPCPAGEHTRQFDQLPAPDAELGDRSRKRKIAEPHPFQGGSGELGKRLAAVKQRGFAVTKPDIVEHRKRRSEAELLRHQRDAKRLGVVRVNDFGRRAVNANHPAVSRMHPGDDLDQRALARAVLAANRADLAGIQRERDVLENLVRAEPLGESFDGEDGH
jgi:hypothetical protein